MLNNRPSVCYYEGCLALPSWLLSVERCKWSRSCCLNLTNRHLCVRLTCTAIADMHPLLASRVPCNWVRDTTQPIITFSTSARILQTHCDSAIIQLANPINIGDRGHTVTVLKHLISTRCGTVSARLRVILLHSTHQSECKRTTST